MDISIALIVLSIIVIIVVAVQFNKILGQRTGNEKPISQILEKSISINSLKIKNAEKEEAETTSIINIENIIEDIDKIAPVDSKINQNLRKIYEKDKKFSPKQFLAYVEDIYEKILDAFAKNEISKIRDFLSDNVSKAFTKAIEENKSKGNNISFNFVGSDKIKIMDVDIDGNIAYITVKFVSEVVYAITDEAGNVLSGKNNDLTILDEEWVFCSELPTTESPWFVCATTN